MGILDDLVYSLRRSSKGQTQQLPSIRDRQLHEQMQAALGQSDPMMHSPQGLDNQQGLMQGYPTSASQELPNGLLAAMNQYQPPINVDQAVFSGKKKFKVK
jgi:hypothetical protein